MGSSPQGGWDTAGGARSLPAPEAVIMVTVPRAPQHLEAKATLKPAIYQFVFPAMLSPCFLQNTPPACLHGEWPQAHVTAAEVLAGQGLHPGPQHAGRRERPGASRSWAMACGAGAGAETGPGFHQNTRRTPVLCASAERRKKVTAALVISKGSQRTSARPCSSG